MRKICVVYRKVRRADHRRNRHTAANDRQPPPLRSPRRPPFELMRSALLRSFVTPLASVRPTVALLVLSLLMVFAATFD